MNACALLAASAWLFAGLGAADETPILDALPSLPGPSGLTGPRLDRLFDGARGAGEPIPVPVPADAARETPSAPIPEDRREAPEPIASLARKLADKARRAQRQTEAVLTPEGLIGSNSDTAIWTGMYVAGMAYRYAATKDPAALAAMEKSLAGLHALQEVTGVPGLIARKIDCGDAALSKEDRRHPGRGRFAGCAWKGRLSFDQYLGWLYGVSEAWPHIQDPELRRQIQEDVRQVALHFMANDGKIVALDTYLDSSPQNYYQHLLPWWLAWLKPLTNLLPARGGNAMHGLHLLKVASVITQDPAIEGYYRKLIDEKDYHRRVQDHTQGRSEELIKKNRWWVRPLVKLLFGWDVEPTPDSLRSSVGMNLGHVAIYNLARLEEDPELRQYYLNGLHSAHAAVAAHGNAFWNFLHASQWGPDQGVADGLDTIERFPIEGRGEVRNSENPDLPRYKGLQTNFFKSDQRWNWFTTEPLPFEDRVLHSFAWQHNALQMDGGGFDPKVDGGGAYLVAYWLGRLRGWVPEEAPELSN